MSQTISTPSQIRNSPLNTSPSKAQYSFPKELRFQSQKNLSTGSAFYDIPNARSTRQAGIGYGQKYDFTKYASKTPAPSQYETQSIFNPQNFKNGKSFGLSRDQVGQGIMGNLKVSGQQPGPGSYQKPSMLSNIKFTMRSKGSNIFAQKLNVPGPGSYTTLPSINGTGKFPLSKYKSSGGTVFSPSGQRFQKDFGDNVPGSQYNSIDTLSKDGKYVVSSHKSAQVRSFSHGIRDTLGLGGKALTPGPGSYKLPSDFGHY